MHRLLILLQFVLLLLRSEVDAAIEPVEQRVTVVRVTSGSHLAFSTNFYGQLLQSTSTSGADWSTWSVVDSTGDITSNPVATVRLATSRGLSQTGSSTSVQVFAQTKNGQVVCFQNTPTSFSRKYISSSIPVALPSSQFSVDAVQLVSLNNVTNVFVRSQTNTSGVYWGSQLPNGTWSEFVPIGDSKNFLYSDQFAVVNTFVNRMEVYGLFQDGHIHHTWQTGPTSFSDKWHKLGSALSKTKFSSAPVVHPMAPSFFNGNLEVFCRGTDGILRHLWQTTCDKVKNPWGPCTWEPSFHNIGKSKTPADVSLVNVLSVNRNIHLGQEVFVVGSSNKHLYHVWQSEEDASWSDWEDLGPLSSFSGFSSQPTILLDQYGWWQGYALNSDGLLNRYTQTPHTFHLSKNSVPFSQNVSVVWSIPKDEATHQDWIGVYAAGASNNQYVDYRYVGGGQNPTVGTKPSGNISFPLYLPDGKYDLRYLVNKQYDAVLQSTLAVYNSTHDQDWEQLYKGFAMGMGGLNTNITKCVKDGEGTVDTFKKAFVAFEDREIFTGLHLVAEGLKDFVAALVQCNETVFVEDLEKFIDALISCTEKACVKFLLDLGLEILILYERVYEIYGDILAAHNSFEIEAYEQGGICIGRVTYACLALPDYMHS